MFNYKCNDCESTINSNIPNTQKANTKTCWDVKEIRVTIKRDHLLPVLLVTQKAIYLNVKLLKYIEQAKLSVCFANCSNRLAFSRLLPFCLNLRHLPLQVVAYLLHFRLRLKKQTFRDQIYWRCFTSFPLVFGKKILKWSHYFLL